MTKTIRAVILALACASCLAAGTPTSGGTAASNSRPGPAPGLGGNVGGGY